MQDTLAQLPQKANSKKPPEKTQVIRDGIVSEINTLHSKNVGAAKSTIGRAIRIGQLLTKKKSTLKHGEWMPWLEKNIDFDDRTARRYINCFENKERLKLDSVSNLADAYRLLTEPKRVLPAPQVDPAEFAELDKLLAEAQHAFEQTREALAKMQGILDPAAFRDYVDATFTFRDGQGHVVFSSQDFLELIGFKGDA